LKANETFIFQIETELESDGTSCPAALLRLGVPAQRLTSICLISMIIKKFLQDKQSYHSNAMFSMSPMFFLFYASRNASIVFSFLKALLLELRRPLLKI